MLKQIYNLIMNPKMNPLRSLPAVQRFQLMVVLSIMWTAIFCAAAGAWFIYGELVAAHLLVASGILATALTFKNAEERRT